MWHVYVLRSKKNGNLYVGISENVFDRVRQHNAGMTISTKPHRPYELVHHEAVGTRQEARTRELQLKSGTGREQIKRMYSKAASGTCLPKVGSS